MREREDLDTYPEGHWLFYPYSCILTYGDGSDGDFSVSLTLKASPYALEVAKQSVPDPVQAGSLLTYTVLITNTGTMDLHAMITDTLPLSVTLGKTSGSTLLPPGGPMEIIWTAEITAAGGVWTDQVVVTVEMGYIGLLTNVVEVATVEGATGMYTETSTVEAGFEYIYLPLVLRNS